MKRNENCMLQVSQRRSEALKMIFYIGYENKSLQCSVSREVSFNESHSIILDNKVFYM